MLCFARFALTTISLLLILQLGVNAQPKIISSPEAPSAIGPYSQAVVAGGLVFVSGQLGIDPGTGHFVQGGIRQQTEQVILNLQAVLKSAGSRLEDVVRCTVFLEDLDNYAEMNEVYAKYFGKAPPSRAAVEVARLPKDGLVEISCIAVAP